MSGGYFPVQIPTADGGSTTKWVTAGHGPASIARQPGPVSQYLHLQNETKPTPGKKNHYVYFSDFY